MKLISVHGKLMVVGDPEQTIFTWRYANVKNLEKIIERYPNSKKIYLKQNYRSTQTILRTSSKLMQKIRNENENRELISKIGEGEKIKIKECFSIGHEIKFITDQIHSLKKEKNYKYGDFSILCRKNSIIKGNKIGNCLK